MSAKQRLLRGLVSIGLRAEQRHAQPTEHDTVLACARRECFAVLTSKKKADDRIWAWLVSHRRKGTSLHFRPHVRRSGRFVTVEFVKSDNCWRSIEISANGRQHHLPTNA